MENMVIATHSGAGSLMYNRQQFDLYICLCGNIVATTGIIYVYGLAVRYAGVYHGIGLNGPFASISLRPCSMFDKKCYSKSNLKICGSVLSRN